MIHIVLYQPEIPPNTGNIIRLCANTGTALHLIKPLGFTLDDARLQRAGLDYHEWASVHQHAALDDCLTDIAPTTVFAISTKGRRRYTDVDYATTGNTALLFGPETRGLPPEVLGNMPPDHVLRIPMQPDSRSLNLSNAVAVILYEALRQQQFTGLA